MTISNPSAMHPSFSWAHDLKITSVILACGAANAINIAKLAPTIEVIQSAFGLSLPIMGLLAALFSAMFVLAGVLLGVTVKAIGAKHALLFGMGMALIGSLITLLIQSATSLFIGRIIEGIGLITVMLSSPSLVSQHTSEARRGLLMGIWSGFMPLGNALALLGAPLILLKASWPAIWQIGFILMAICFVLGLLVIPQDKVKASGKFDFAVIKTAISRRGIFVLGLLFACHSIVYQATLQFMPSFGKSIFSIPIFYSSLITVGFCLLSFLGNIVGGQMLMRGLMPKRIVATAGILLGVFMLLMSIIPSMPFTQVMPYIFGIVLTCFGLISGFVPTICFYAMSKERSDDARDMPIFTAWMFQIQGMGMFLGPVIFATIVDTSSSWLIAIGVFSIFCFAKTGLSFFVKIKDQ